MHDRVCDPRHQAERDGSCRDPTCFARVPGTTMLQGAIRILHPLLCATCGMQLVLPLRLFSLQLCLLNHTHRLRHCLRLMSVHTRGGLLTAMRTPSSISLCILLTPNSVRSQSLCIAIAHTLVERLAAARFIICTRKRASNHEGTSEQRKAREAKARRQRKRVWSPPSSQWFLFLLAESPWPTKSSPHSSS